jgi:hypothetical protein
MKIETKFNILDIVYCLFQNKIVTGYVQKIVYEEILNVFDNSIYKNLYYKVTINKLVLKPDFDELELFKTKEELIDSL